MGLITSSFDSIMFYFYLLCIRRLTEMQAVLKLLIRSSC